MIQFERGSPCPRGIVSWDTRSEAFVEILYLRGSVDSLQFFSLFVACVLLLDIVEAVFIFTSEA